MRVIIWNVSLNKRDYNIVNVIILYCIGMHISPENKEALKFSADDEFDRHLRIYFSCGFL